MMKTDKNVLGATAPVNTPYLLLVVAFVVCLIISNLTEIKTIDLGYFTITAGVVVFPISYIINDCVAEVYGYARARFMIWLGFAMSLFTALMLNVAIWLPGGVDWQWQEAMTCIYGSVPRIMCASFLAFVCGSLVNARVMVVMKAAAGRRSGGDGAGAYRAAFSARAIASTLLGEGVDSLIFFPTAFAGVLPWGTILSLIITQALVKTVYEILVLPITIMVVGKLRTINGDKANTLHDGVS